MNVLLHAVQVLQSKSQRTVQVAVVAADKNTHGRACTELPEVDGQAFCALPHSRTQVMR